MPLSSTDSNFLHSCLLCIPRCPDEKQNKFARRKLWGVSAKKLENTVISCLLDSQLLSQGSSSSPQPFLLPLPISCLLPGPWAAFGTGNRSNSEAFVPQARARSALFLTLILRWLCDFTVWVPSSRLALLSLLLPLHTAPPDPRVPL